MQADLNTTNIRSFYSATNNQRNALRRQQLTESQYITGRNNSTRNRWLFRTAVKLSRQWAARSKRIIWLFSSAIQITIDVSKLPHLRPSLISQWPFGVLVRQAASSKYLVDNRHNGVNSHCHPSTSAHGVSLTPTGAAICRDNDLADGVWVLFFLRSRLLGTIGAGGVTPTGLVTFRTEQAEGRSSEGLVRTVVKGIRLTVRDNGSSSVLAESREPEDVRKGDRHPQEFLDPDHSPRRGRYTGSTLNYTVHLPLGRTNDRLVYSHLKNRSRVLYARDTQVQFARRSIVRQMRVDCMMWILLDQPNTG
ncbi:hypothetical protein T07_6767 [Trichinella nelsoni]|uniref:Uncharacterized protein n=1 Tax=Trichinella nelsoni TaxID=6336 RepID=A0A0V0REY7_9BILA|nr:hypothetical protein T07_6767 [Trichinella nelsoni]